MKEDFIDINLMGETGHFYKQDGKIFCEGYDREDENIAVQLSGGGSGLGVLLLALEDFDNEEDWKKLLKTFEAEAVRIPSSHRFTRNFVSKCPLIYSYLSYSLQSRMRENIAEVAVGVESMRDNSQENIYRRLLRDREMKVVIRAAGNAPPHLLDEEAIRRLAAIEGDDIYWLLAGLENLPNDIAKKIANSHHEVSKERLCQRKNISTEVIIDLANSIDLNVRRKLLEREILPAVVVSSFWNSPNLELRREAFAWAGKALREGRIDRTFYDLCFKADHTLLGFAF